MLAFVGLRLPCLSWLCIDCCGFIGCSGPALAVMAFVGCRGPALAFIGCHRPSVAFCGSGMAVVGSGKGNFLLV